jgi:hypothetical protein
MPASTGQAAPPSPEPAGFCQVLRTRAAELAARHAATADPAGRGIVLVAGGSRLFTNAYVLLRVLRGALRCRLPVELWYFGRTEMSAAMAAMLAPLEVRLVDAQAVLDRVGVGLRDGWQLKPFALLWSSFAEVLMLDADQVPTRDLDELFSWPAFRAHGAVFWPDNVDIAADNPIWPLLGLAAEATTSLESGQVLVDKLRHRQALAMAVTLNEHAETLYRLIYGDKDTFLMAWRLTGASMALVPHRPLADERCLFQRDFAGAVLFQHRTRCKWTYLGEQYRVSPFAHEAECLAALDELRRQWNGRVFNAPARGAAARSVETRLAQAGSFVLDVRDEPPVQVELRPHGELRAGRAYDRENWYVAASDPAGEPPRLVFCNGDGSTYEMTEIEPDVWAGRRLRFPVVDVVLRTRSAQSHPPHAASLVDDLLRAGGFWSGSVLEAELVRTLVLLARVETGVAARLHALADACPPTRPGDAARLRRLAQAVAEGDRALGPLSGHDAALLHRGYLDGSV